MKPAYLRKLTRQFDPVYFRPEKAGRIAGLLRYPAVRVPQDDEQRAAHRQLDRRCGIERRSRQLPVMLDTRSPHARRKQRQRRQQDWDSHDQVGIGIDVYT